MPIQISFIMQNFSSWSALHKPRNWVGLGKKYIYMWMWHFSQILCLWVINKIHGMTRATNIWQGCLLDNYKFNWSQVWDLAWSCKEAAFMCFIWHKAVVVDELRACIVPASISKQCVFLPPQYKQTIEDKSWDCIIQAQQTWRWANFIMHELCGV